MIVIEILVQKIIISIISICVPQCGLPDSQENNFYKRSYHFLLESQGERDCGYNKRL